MRRVGNSGFTLLEVPIVFAIASIALAVLYQGATDGLPGSRPAVRTDEAITRARSRDPADLISGFRREGPPDGNQPRALRVAAQFHSFSDLI